MAVKRKIRLKKNVKIFFIYIILFGILGYSLFNILIWGKDNKKNNDIKKDIIEEVQIQVKDDEEETYIETDLRKLKEINNETVAWIQVPSTNINYPVVQASDNEFYLTNNFYKEYNEAGWIFLDYRNKLDEDDDHIIVYGHNRLDGSMFGTLKRSLNENWLRSNKYVFFNTIDFSNTYIIFSAYSINADDFKNNVSFNSKETYKKYLDEIKNRSIVDLGIEVTADDKIITLYTCANNNIDRTIVHAKLVQKVKAS